MRYVVAGEREDNCFGIVHVYDAFDGNLVKSIVPGSMRESIVPITNHVYGNSSEKDRWERFALRNTDFNVVDLATLSPDGCKLATTTRSRYKYQFICIWDVSPADINLVLTFDHNQGRRDEARIKNMSFNANNHHLITLTSYVIKIWNTNNGVCIRAVRNKSNRCLYHYACFGCNYLYSNQFATVSDLITVWNSSKGLQFGIRYRVSTVVFNNNDSLLVSGSYDGKICLWETGQRHLLHECVGHYTEGISDPILQVSFNSDGTKIASSSLNVIKVWHLTYSTSTTSLSECFSWNANDTCRLILTTVFHPNNVNVFALALVADSVPSNTVQLLDITTDTALSTVTPDFDFNLNGVGMRHNAWLSVPPLPEYVLK